ncbi:hypothetical protein KJ603_01500 [Patescibacteria group bacterium]|nr:hypothetical protein [Patescibacteria group bacterium]
MGIRFDRVLENPKTKVMVVNNHNRTNGTFVRMEVLNILIPGQKEFEMVWADVRAEWMKVTPDKEKSVVEVRLAMSVETFRERFPKAAAAADNFKLHEKFKNQRFQKPSYNNVNTQRFVRESTRAYGGSMYA